MEWLPAARRQVALNLNFLPVGPSLFLSWSHRLTIISSPSSGSVLTGISCVTDAMTDRGDETHSYCVEKVFPRLGERDTTENLLRLLQDQK
jgi:hypothetical protein